MTDTTDSTSPVVARLLNEALEAAGAGRHAAADDLLARAACEERAIELAQLPQRYWADGLELRVESADGTGPCAIFQLQTGYVDMAQLAELLNRREALDLTPRSNLTERDRFIVDSEYVTCEEPLTVLCGFDLARQVAEILNSASGPALLLR